MEKFSDIFEKNQNTKNYNFIVFVKFEGFDAVTLKGTLKSFSEGDAGEQVDKMMDSFPTLEKLQHSRNRKCLKKFTIFHHYSHINYVKTLSMFLILMKINMLIFYAKHFTPQILS